MSNRPNTYLVKSVVSFVLFTQHDLTPYIIARGNLVKSVVSFPLFTQHDLTPYIIAQVNLSQQVAPAILDFSQKLHKIDKKGTTC